MINSVASLAKSAVKSQELNESAASYTTENKNMSKQV